MTVDDALNIADVTYPARPHNFDALEALANEVRRYRAAVEAIRNHPEPPVPFVSTKGDFVLRAEVLAILEPK